MLAYFKHLAKANIFELVLVCEKKQKKPKPNTHTNAILFVSFILFWLMFFFFPLCFFIKYSIEIIAFRIQHRYRNVTHTFAFNICILMHAYMNANVFFVREI